MAVTLAFDVYGTLLDTQGVMTLLEGMVGGLAGEFSRSWRDKQLEYSFRRGLMRQYRDFGVCTRDALEYCCQLYGVDLGVAQKQGLLDSYHALPAFADVEPALDRLSDAGLPLYAFSNGTAAAVDTALQAAGIRDRFEQVISVENIHSFKPDPAVYQDFLRRAVAKASQAWLISGNSFDVIGARAAGMNAAWVRRSPAAVFDPWGIDPTLVVDDLGQLADRFTQAGDSR